MTEPDSAKGATGLKDQITLGFVSVLFVGYAPVASGTFGSLPGIVAAYWLRDRQVALLILSIVLFALGVAASSRAEKILGEKDPGKVVIDEFVGILVAFLWIPMTWKSVIIVFLLFRAFDIVKPPPARNFDRLEGGFGIMADDLVAGIYANLAYRIIALFF